MKLSQNKTSFLKKTISLALLCSFAFSNFIAVEALAATASQPASETFSTATFTTDLTQLGRDGRLRENLNFENETMGLLKVLAGGDVRQPVLVDEKGESQDLIVEQLAILLAKGTAPSGLSKKTILKLETAKLWSNAKSQAELVAGINESVDAAIASNGQTILFVDQLPSLLGLQPVREKVAAAITAKKLVMIGGSSKGAWDEKIAASADVAGLFEAVYVGGGNAASGSKSTPPSERLPFRGDNVSSDLRKMMSDDASGETRVDVILQAKNADDQALRALLASGKATVSDRVGKTNTLVVNLPLSAVQSLSASGLVNYISPDRAIKTLGHVENTTGTSQMRSQPAGYGRSAGYTLDGSGVGIAILDSGIFATQKSFTDGTGASRVVYSQSFVPGVTSTEDDYGHGTHVASIAAGNASRDTGAYRGVAPKANLINLKVLDANGVGTTSALLNALNWVISNRTAYNIRVVNLSLGTPSLDAWTNDALCRKVQDLNYYGILVVAAAGNGGKDSTG
ncbi:MAG TPA: S8 family serine peptidase, partial [Pyrinomonadaceae bacterium]|nr:S8 family serine peptidase [Pyrinomonadaceae bacterium]